MDSKQALPASSGSASEETAPPSYTESLFTSSESSSSSTSRYYSHQIQDQLQSIASQITSLQTQKVLFSNAKDEKILSVLTTQIQIYLAEFAKSGLRKGTLILVPSKGLVDPNAVPVEYDFKDPNEYDRVVRVRDKGAEEFEFGSGDDGEMWFWRDEDMARRLARFLTPVDQRYRELPRRKEEARPRVVELQGEGSGSGSKGFWGRKKSMVKSVESVERPVVPKVEERGDGEVEVDPYRKKAGTEGRVAMSVKAEEVVFRTENAFGIFETERGWGVVLKLNVVLGSR